MARFAGFWPSGSRQRLRPTLLKNWAGAAEGRGPLIAGIRLVGKSSPLFPVVFVPAISAALPVLLHYCPVFERLGALGITPLPQQTFLGHRGDQRAVGGEDQAA